jgi:ribonuclease BN (tRNA processing enzyme)
MRRRKSRRPSVRAYAARRDSRISEGGPVRVTKGLSGCPASWLLHPNYRTSLAKVAATDSGHEETSRALSFNLASVPCNPQTYPFRWLVPSATIPTELPAGRADIPNFMAGGDAIGGRHLNTDGFVDLVLSRWAFHGTGPKIDAVCSSDVVSPQGFTISCRNFVAHMADAFIQSGEIAQRHSEVKERTAGGPAELVNTITFDPKDEPQLVWASGGAMVSAIRSTHIPGHVSYRVDTPAGSVVIGGDAVNDVLAPPRKHSTSDQVERLAKGADIIVHSAIHPIMGPGMGSDMHPYAFYRQSTATDLGTMAQRDGAKYLVLTHLIPSLGANEQYPFKVPGRPLKEADYVRVGSKAAVLVTRGGGSFTPVSGRTGSGREVHRVPLWLL